MREHHTCFLGADAERLHKHWAGAEHVDAPGCTELIQESEHRRGVVFIHTVIYMGLGGLSSAASHLSVQVATMGVEPLANHIHVRFQIVTGTLGRCFPPCRLVQHAIFTNEGMHAAAAAATPIMLHHPMVLSAPLHIVLGRLQIGVMLGEIFAGHLLDQVQVFLRQQVGVRVFHHTVIYTGFHHLSSA